MSRIVGMSAMQLGETCWRDAPDAAVWSDFVVVATPLGDGDPRLVQALEPVLIEALIAELAVKAFDT